MHHAHAVAFRVAGHADSPHKPVTTLRRQISSDLVTVIKLAFDRGLGPALALGALKQTGQAPEVANAAAASWFTSEAAVAG